MTTATTITPGVQLVAEHVRVHLNRRVVLEDASVRVGAGEIVGLVGPNGSGKTTFVRALMGFLPLSGGQIRLDDRALDEWRPFDRARRLAYVAQTGGSHWPLHVRNVVALGRLPYAGMLGRARAEDDDAIDEAMRAMQVEHLADCPVSAISGGERMRVLLARALASNPALLLADEPTASLDPYHQLRTLEILSSLATGSRGVLVVLHDLTLAARFCQRVVLMDRGRTRVDGTPSETFEASHLAATFNIALWPGRETTGPVLFPWQRMSRRSSTEAFDSEEPES
jgi:iron complex transport system ATP-binding protein